jgi:Holliday junction resolvasome RuvABC DNA-binding subunit
MGSPLKKLNKGKVSPSPVHNLKTVYELGYNKGAADGYNQGVADQRKLDIESVVSLLNDLESLPGIGESTANKIRILVASKFGGK